MDDYETCSLCNHDHEYERAHANREHMRMLDSELRKRAESLHDDCVEAILIRLFIQAIYKKPSNLLDKIKANHRAIEKYPKLYRIFDEHGII